MSPPLAQRLRRLWLDVHLWIGVGLLLALAPLALSGAVLVWHDPLDRALHPERYAVSGTAEIPMAAYAAAAQAAFAGRAQLTQVRAPLAPGDPAVAQGRLPGPPGPGGRPRSLNAWIDPPTGRVLGTAELARGATMVLHRFHGTLLVPGVGRKIVGWLGWAMFASCATGLWLWWPRRAGFLAGLRWRRGASQLFNLHHAVGVWICLPLAVLSLTGVYIAFPQTAQKLTGAAPPRPQAAPGPGAATGRAVPPPLDDPALTPGQAVAAALALHPQARVTVLGLPQAGGRRVWRVELGAGRAVEVEDATGRAQDARPRPPVAGRSGLAGWMRGVHDGSRLGPLWQVAITLGGIAPTLLGVTGVVMWLRRRERRRRLQTALA